MGKIVLRQVPTGVKFDLHAGNGEIIATSEVYKTAAACRQGVLSLILIKKFKNFINNIINLFFT